MYIAQALMWRWGIDIENFVQPQHSAPRYHRANEREISFHEISILKSF